MYVYIYIAREGFLSPKEKRKISFPNTDCKLFSSPIKNTTQRGY